MSRLELRHRLPSSDRPRSSAEAQLPQAFGLASVRPPWRSGPPRCFVQSVLARRSPEGDLDGTVAVADQTVFTCVTRLAWAWITRITVTEDAQAFLGEYAGHATLASNSIQSSSSLPYGQLGIQLNLARRRRPPDPASSAHPRSCRWDPRCPSGACACGSRTGRARPC